MITADEHKRLRDRIDRYESARQTHFPKQCCFTPEDIARVVSVAGVDRAPTNEERSAVEVFEFHSDPPQRYFLYINQEKRIATTWTGDKLGDVSFGRAWRDNFGGERVPISVRAINGRSYHGTYYRSSGDYARITLSKR